MRDDNAQQMIDEQAHQEWQAQQMERQQDKERELAQTYNEHQTKEVK
ncbi:MAG: hypothetical protein ABIU85_09595 [Methylotenera sp.]